MPRVAITTLQVGVAVLLLLLVLAQVWVLPSVAQDYARQYPEAAFLRTPVLVLAIGTVACVQLALLCVGKLLTLVSQERIFDAAADRYVDVFIGTTVVAAALVLGTGVYVSATAGSPAWVSSSLVALVGAGIALLMVVMRALLRQATQEHAELAEVV